MSDTARLLMASTKMTAKEAIQIRKATVLGDELLRRTLRERASFAAHDFTRPEDLRELAACALVLSRRLDDPDYRPERYRA